MRQVLDSRRKKDQDDATWFGVGDTKQIGSRANDTESQDSQGDQNGDIYYRKTKAIMKLLDKERNSGVLQQLQNAKTYQEQHERNLSKLQNLKSTVQRLKEKAKTSTGTSADLELRISALEDQVEILAAENNNLRTLIAQINS